MSNLCWSTQIHEVCLKANKKLSVLRNVKILKRKTLDLLYKVTVRSVIDYALPIYSNTLKQTELARLEQIQYRAAKLVTGALHFTSMEKLNIELGWETIKKRTEFLGLSLFHKIHLHETRPLSRTCLSKLDFEKQFVSRSKGGYLPYQNFGTKFLNSFFPFFSKLWNNLPPSTQALNLIDFKSKLKLDTKPIKVKHYTYGSKLGNTLLTRCRVDRTTLNLHRFTIGQVDDPTCICHYKEESSRHLILDCFLYTAERQILYSLVEHYIPNFSNMTKTAKYDLLMTGIKHDDPDFHYLNITITISVQNFLLQTKRFLHPYD